MFKIDTTHKAQIIALCSFAGSRANEIYDRVLVKFGLNKVTLTSSNSTQFNTITIPAYTEGHGEFCISSKRLSAVMTALVGKEAKFTLNTANQDKQHLTASSAKTRLKLQVFETDDYPAMNNVKHPQSRIFCCIKDIEIWNNSTNYCVANGDARQYLGNFNLVVSEWGIGISATDGHRLSKLTAECSTEGNGTFLLPKSFFSAISSQRLPLDTQCELVISTQRIQLNTPNFSTVCALTDSKYPDIDRAIPSDNLPYVAFNLERLSELSKRFHALAAIENRNAIKINICPSSNTASFEVGSTDQTNQMSEELALESCMLPDGAELVYAFNSQYLLDALGQQAGKVVKLFLNGSGASKLCSEIQNLTTILMPMRV